MRKGILKVVAIVISVMALSLILSQVASAAISWCSDDLATLSTAAQQNMSDQAAGIQAQHVVTVPSQAVSVANGGTNTHK